MSCIISDLFPFTPCICSFPLTSYNNIASSSWLLGVKILLEPLSLLALSGESRHGFTHAIRQSKRVPLRDGSVLRRGKTFRRVSLTFRGASPGLVLRPNAGCGGGFRARKRSLRGFSYLCRSFGNGGIIPEQQSATRSDFPEGFRTYALPEKYRETPV